MKRLLIFFAWIPLGCRSQDLTAGDSAYVKVLQPALSGIYQQKDTTLFFLTKRSFIPEKTFAASITCYASAKRPNRIVVVHTLSSGLLSQEFFLQDSQLIFCYESMEYFDSSRSATWRNFKQLPARESRYYFAGGRLVFQKHTGLSTLPDGREVALQAEWRKLRTFISSRHPFLLLDK